MLGNTQQQTLKQTLKLSPQQIQMLNLLQLPVLELDQKIKDEIEENPALEYDEFLNNTEGGGESAESENYEVEGSEERDEPISYDMADDSRDDGYAPAVTNDYEKPMVEVQTFRDNLKEQLRFRSVDPKIRAYAEYLIDAIDDDGYLRRNLSDITDDLSFALNVFVEEDTLEKALQEVHSLDPVGIGSRNAQEYLMYQLREKAKIGAEVSVACAIVGEFMDELGNHQYEKIKNALHIDNVILKNAIELIGSLNPKPVNGIASMNNEIITIVPDFIVTDNEGHLEITVLGINHYRVKLNQNMLETLEALEKSPDKNANNRSAAQYLKSKIGSAQWLISALEQREYSLTRTIETIVALQEKFFRTGDIRTLRPMILKDIADRVGLDISTISRVTSTRYVQTDFGIIPLRELFTEGVLTESGELVSNRVLQTMITEIVNSEDKSAPLSDQQLAGIMAEKGYPLARRTVAKYRENLNIPTAQIRKSL